MRSCGMWVLLWVGGLDACIGRIQGVRGFRAVDFDVGLYVCL